MLAPLGEALEDDAPRRHVDAQGHGLGGEDHLAQPALEERLDQPLQARQDAGVVQPHAEAQPLEDALVERRLADGRRLPQRLVNGHVDLAALLAREQGPALGEHVVQRALAAGAAEDEVDGGQPSARLQRLDEDDGRDHAPRVPAAARVGPARLVAHQAGAPVAHPRHVVDLAGEVRHRVGERDGALGMLDGDDGPVHDGDPVGDLLDVGHGGREGHELHVAGGVHDDLLPHRAAPLVAHVVALVEDHVAQLVEAAGVEHVAEDLRGHHQEPPARVDLDVAGEDADDVFAEGPGEVAELLVGEGLQRRGVGQALAGLQGELDGELRHQRLARAGRRGHDDRLPGGDGAGRLHLEIVEGKRILRAETLEEIHRDHSSTAMVSCPHTLAPGGAAA